jgi:predicted DNA-binding protein with PD1-like motif
MQIFKFLILTLCFCFLKNVDMNAQNLSATHLSDFKAIAIRLKPGEDLKVQLDAFIKANGIKAASIVTCVGSLQQAAIRYANQPGTDTLTGKFEIVSLTGTMEETGSHLHISISDSTGRTIGGHLKEGSIVYTTAEIVLGLLPDIVFERQVDPTYGYKELVIKKRKKNT